MKPSIINIQSISDTITNSSSEIFCRIDSDEETLNSILDLLQDIFYIGYSEDEPSIELMFEDTESPYIEISLPYNYSSSCKFYQAGLNAILKDFNCNINYDISN